MKVEYYNQLTLKQILFIVLFPLSVLLGNITVVRAQEPESPMYVREDRVWEYEYIYDEWHIHYELLKYKFDGTEDIDGKTYHRLKNFHVTSWDIDNNDYLGSEEKYTDTTIALIREDEGKVWMRNTLDEVRTQVSASTDSDWEWKYLDDVEEILLFDFKGQPGDKEWVWACHPLGKNTFFFQTEFIINEITEDQGHKCFNLSRC